MSNKKPFHYFASSFANWSCSDDLLDCLNKQKRADKNSGLTVKCCSVFFVPVPDDKDHPYKIENYAPQVEGAMQIDVVIYDKKDRNDPKLFDRFKRFYDMTKTVLVETQTRIMMIG